MITLPFSSLPGTTRLFLDYCAGTGNAPNFFLGHFTDLLAYETHLQFLEQRSYHRRELAAILRETNRSAGAGDATMHAIDAFERETTFAVVTGQQVGLFGGPLYTIYKALTAKTLAQWLAEQFPAYTFVPVFWMETEDHDLDEADTTSFINAQNDTVTLRAFAEDFERGAHTRPVGATPFDAGVDEAVKRFFAESPRSEFTEWIERITREAYHEGATFASAFARMFHALLPDSGIILLDPSQHDLKQLLTPVILQEIETHPTSGEEVIKRSAELEGRYHAQIKPRAVNLFYAHRGGRHAVEPGDQGFFLKGSRQRFSKEEFTGRAAEAPEAFSPNVLLRPIFQDYLLPTVAYVAGPSEVAYFAQLQPVYDHFQVPMPIIFPRASLTIIEKKIQKVVDKFQLAYASMFEDPEAVYRDMSADAEDAAPLRALEQLREQLGEALSALPTIGAGISPNLKDPAENTVRNIERTLSTFADKAYASYKERDTVIRRQLEKMQVYLAPGGKPQERVYSILTFVNRYGPSLLAEIEQSCAPFPAEHRLLML